MAYTVVGVLLLGVTTNGRRQIAIAVVSNRPGLDHRGRGPRSPPSCAPWCGSPAPAPQRTRPPRTGRRLRRRHPRSSRRRWPGRRVRQPRRHRLVPRPDRLGLGRPSSTRYRGTARASERPGSSSRTGRPTLLPQLLLGTAHRGRVDLPSGDPRADRLVLHAPLAAPARHPRCSPAAARPRTSPCSSARCASARCSAPPPRRSPSPRG